MSIIDLQRELSAGLRVIKTFIRNEHPDGMLPDQFSTSRDESERIEDMLKWVALCLMTGGARKNVAVALTVDRTLGDMKFIVSSYPDQGPNESDNKVIEDFKSCIVLTLDEIKTQKEKYEKRSGLIRFLDLTVKHNWPEVQATIVQIRSSKYHNDKSEILLHFKSLIAKWSEHQEHSSRAPRKEHDLLIEAATKSFDDESKTTEMIIKSFTDLLQKEEPDAGLNETELQSARSEFMRQLLNNCTWIEISNFMTDSLDDNTDIDTWRWRRLMSDKDRPFLAEVQEHIRSLQIYYAGVVAFHTQGLKRINTLFRKQPNREAFLSKIQFEWITRIDTTAKPDAPDARPALTWSKEPQTWATECVEASEPDLLNSASEDKIKAFESAVSTLWNRNEEIQGVVHCEIALAYHLLYNDITAWHQVMGVAKPLCWACCYFLGEYKERKGFPRYTASSMPLSDDWIIPSAISLEAEDWELEIMKVVCKHTRESSDGFLRHILKNGWDVR